MIISKILLVWFAATGILLFFYAWRGIIAAWREPVLKRPVIIIESDDWGSIRMPSKETYNNLVKAGIKVEQSNYNRLDSLECNRDLESLFELLSAFKDKTGNHPVFTGVCVVANPEFQKMKAEIEQLRNKISELEHIIASLKEADYVKLSKSK